MFRVLHFAQLRMIQLRREPPIENKNKISYTIRIILIKSVANKFID